VKIAYYLHHSTLKAGGIFTYSIGILKLLIASPAVDVIYLIHSENQRDYIREKFIDPKVRPVEIARFSLLNKARFGLAYLLFDLAFIYGQYNTSRLLRWVKKLSLLINPYRKVDRLKADIFHVPLQFSPIYGIKTPVLTTMHDVQELHFPDYFTSGERLHRALHSKKAMDLSDHVMVSFSHIKADLITYFQKKPTEISVCPPPFHTNWFGTENHTQPGILRQKYALQKDFILYPAATWQHKNHLRLFEALKNLNANGHDIDLVCTGHQTAYMQELEKYILREGLSPRISFLGIVPEEDLIGLYKMARLTVIPTLYEAGSGPLYEAMRYQVPVICSSVTSLPETMQDPAFLFDPTNLDEMTKMIGKGWKDEDFRKKNMENSILRMHELSKADYADAFIKAYQTSRKSR